jgi:hypothetical protein
MSTRKGSTTCLWHSTTTLVRPDALTQAHARALCLLWSCPTDIRSSGRWSAQGREGRVGKAVEAEVGLEVLGIPNEAEQLYSNQ